jgi:hypothetical protein
VYGVKTLIARYPFVAMPLERLRGHGEVVGPHTDIVIEAFPRSASSFAVAAFRLAQEPRPMTIAHHTHMPASVLVAVRREIPTLVLLRRAEDAVTSLLIRNPELPVGQALRGYVRFYEPLVPHRDRFVVASFEQVIHDFGGVIRRVNERFGTEFVPFEHSDANLARIEREIEVDHRSRTPEAPDLQRTIPLPSAARERVKAEVLARYRAEAPTATLRRADELYEELTTASGS